MVKSVRLVKILCTLVTQVIPCLPYNSIYSGFADQFDFQLTSFDRDLHSYRSLATTDEERSWAGQLDQIRQDAQNLGHGSVRLHGEQAADLQAIITDLALRNALYYCGLADREERVRELLEKMAQIQDEERRLIGLDLHDGLTQLVISAHMHLNALDSVLPASLNGQARRELEESRVLVRRAIDEARRVIAELRPTVVEEYGLADGLRRYVFDVCQAEGWTCEAAISLDQLHLSPQAESAIFRIAQEALSNIRKYARTRAVCVELRPDGENLLLRVQDWGIGFDLAALSDERNRVG